MQITLSNFEECVQSAGAFVDLVVSHPEFKLNLAVQYASKYGNLALVQYLVSVGADIHADDDYAVRFASQNGHLEVVQYLVFVGADIRMNYDCAVR